MEILVQIATMMAIGAYAVLSRDARQKRLRRSCNASARFIAPCSKGAAPIDRYDMRARLRALNDGLATIG